MSMRLRGVQVPCPAESRRGGPNGMVGREMIRSAMCVAEGSDTVTRPGFWQSPERRREEGHTGQLQAQALLPRNLARPDPVSTARRKTSPGYSLRIRNSMLSPEAAAPPEARDAMHAGRAIGPWRPFSG